MTADEVAATLGALADARKAVQRPAAERLAAAAREDPTIRARVASLLTSPDARLRWGAAYTLARLEPAPLDAIPVLVEALGSNDGDLRWAAARILTSAVAAAPPVGTDLIGLCGSPSPLQRKMALYCLRDLAGAVHVERELLVRALADGNTAVRLAALSASAVLLPANEETSDALARLVDDPDPGVRRAAAATLGRVGVWTATTEERLRRASASDDPLLARTAAQALSRLAAAAPSAR